MCSLSTTFSNAPVQPPPPLPSLYTLWPVGLVFNQFDRDRTLLMHLLVAKLSYILSLVLEHRHMGTKSPTKWNASCSVPFFKFCCFPPKDALLPEWFLIAIVSLFMGSVSGDNWKSGRSRTKRGVGKTDSKLCLLFRFACNLQFKTTQP